MLTIISTIACLAFPKLLSTILSPKAQPTEPASPSTQATKVPVTTFPYCTVHTLTGSQFCRFRPRFCDRCTPN
ncbi:hypothetical protein [Tolypothrix sp. PCC 7910]|uniref:hypothetical protein n=1 Tax=Tolypothrix sp. PCC 7910 TaxID=2099387 RepID=UPI0018F0232A|nr:hypothetical protein [Tolypothrix sp. PCC 7910]